MNTKQLPVFLKTLPEKLGRYKYTLLILLLGAALMLFPAKKEPSTQTQTQPQQTEQTDLAQQLELLLTQLDGAGQVRVLLTLEESDARQYQCDTQENRSDTGTQLEQKTVVLNDAPLTVRTFSPVYRGAVVLCQGAGRPSVRLDIINAVSSLTGLGSDKISVIKMKGN